MEKTLDTQTGAVHIITKEQDITYVCACGKRSGLLWEKISEDTPLNCLICLMYEKSGGK